METHLVAPRNLWVCMGGTHIWMYQYGWVWDVVAGHEQLVEILGFVQENVFRFVQWRMRWYSAVGCLVGVVVNHVFISVVFFFSWCVTKCFFSFAILCPSIFEPNLQWTIQIALRIAPFVFITVSHSSLPVAFVSFEPFHGHQLLSFFSMFFPHFLFFQSFTSLENLNDLHPH